jgi:hypothetical protein
MQSRPDKGSPAGSRAHGPVASQARGRAKPARRGPKQPGPGPRPKQRGQRPSRPSPTAAAIKRAVRVWNPNHPGLQPPAAVRPGAAAQPPPPPCRLMPPRHPAAVQATAVLCLILLPFPLLADQSQGPSPAMEAGRRGTARSSPASSGHEDRRCKPRTAEPPPPTHPRALRSGEPPPPQPRRRRSRLCGCSDAGPGHGWRRRWRRSGHSTRAA